MERVTGRGAEQVEELGDRILCPHATLIMRTCVGYVLFGGSPFI